MHTHHLLPQQMLLPRKQETVIELIRHKTQNAHTYQIQRTQTALIRVCPLMDLTFVVAKWLEHLAYFSCFLWNWLLKWTFQLLAGLPATRLPDLNPITQTLGDFGQMVWTDLASDVQKAWESCQRDELQKVDPPNIRCTLSEHVHISTLWNKIVF